MTKILILFTILILLVVIILIILGNISKSGKPPGTIGGKLLKCPNKPNCVCSEYKDDIEHYVDPIIIPQNATGDNMQILKESIQELKGVIQTENSTYIAATFSSSLFGFVDDLEIRFDPSQNVIHFRSSSRVGYSDLGVNRKRAQLIKDLFFKKVKNKLKKQVLGEP